MKNRVTPALPCPSFENREGWGNLILGGASVGQPPRPGRGSPRKLKSCFWVLAEACVRGTPSLSAEFCAWTIPAANIAHISPLLHRAQSLISICRAVRSARPSHRRWQRPGPQCIRLPSYASVLHWLIPFLASFRLFSNADPVALVPVVGPRGLGVSGSQPTPAPD